MKRFKHIYTICVPLMVSLTMLSVLALSACQSETVTAAAAALKQDATATRIKGDMSVFEIPDADVAETPREDLFRLLDALDEAYARLEFQPPFPTIRIVDAKSTKLYRRTLAWAARSNTGEEFLYFNRSHLIGREKLLPLVLHELAHLKAWRQHGLGIEMHGAEFQSICQSVTWRKHCTAME